jgi:hypothetical protein
MGIKGENSYGFHDPMHRVDKYIVIERCQGSSYHQFTKTRNSLKTFNQFEKGMFIVGGIEFALS